MGELVHPDVEIRTERTVHRGRPAAVDWSKKGFEHLDRRYVPIEIEQRDDLVAIRTELQYVWRESGDIGDRSDVTIELGIRDGLISSWHMLEEDSEPD